MKKPTGIILYKGDSVLDKAPIIVIACLNSRNAKTGNMIQTFILRADMPPLEASKQGADISICGNCAHRHYHGGACYVNIGQAPLGIFRAYKRGIYPAFDPALHSKYLETRKIRFGAYGDPAAAPFEMWDMLAHMCQGFTGYTHQARHKNFDSRILEFCQLSLDTRRQAEKAKSGYFRIVTDKAERLPDEIECLADSKGLECKDCLKCNGKNKVFIQVHGSRK
ncbi:MAG: hypothetical protein EBT93_00985, partial [Alphaproteobacteria bacterium]|nr:hypothetical protein [Alphaproteobacteria bacterium]